MQAVELATIPTGIELVRALTALDVTALDDADKLARIVAWERVTAWVAAEQNSAIVDYVGTTPRVQQVQVDGRHLELADVSRTELACALRWSENTAGVRIELARSIAADLPAVAEGLARGAFSMPHARAIIDGATRLLTPIDQALSLAGHLDTASSTDAGTQPVLRQAELRALRTELLAAFQSRVLPYAAEHTVARTREHITRTITRLDPDGVTARRTKAIATQSNVTLRHGDDGMSTLTACMPSELAVACLKTIDARVAQHRAAIRSQGLGSERMGQLRVQALTDLLLDGTRTREAAPTTTDAATAADAGFNHAAHAAARPRVAVDVVIDLHTLLGLRTGTATLAGVGAIPADVVRELIADDPEATLRRLVVDPDHGHLLEHGIRSYAITGRLREFLMTRDQRCRFPDCGRRAEYADIDHARPWDAGGLSTPGNLGPLCRLHHLRKTHAGWHITDSDPTGACTWRSPSGTVRRHEAISHLDEADAATEQLRVQLRGVWDHIDTAREYAACTAPAIARAQSLQQAIDDAHISAHANTLRTAREHGHLCTILTHTLQRHARRTQQQDIGITNDQLRESAPTSRATADDFPPF